MNYTQQITDSVYRNRRPVVIIVSIMIVLTILFFLFKQWDRRSGGSAKNDKSYLEGAGTVELDFIQTEVAQYVERIHLYLEQTYQFPPLFADSERCEVFKSLNQLNINQLIAVANAYENTYNKGLRNVISGVAFSGCSKAQFWKWFDTTPYETLLKTMRDNNIN